MFDIKHAKSSRRTPLGIGVGVSLAGLMAVSGVAVADQYQDAAKRWLDDEFSTSTLTPEQQIA